MLSTHTRHTSENVRDGKHGEARTYSGASFHDRWHSAVSLMLRPDHSRDGHQRLGLVAPGQCRRDQLSSLLEFIRDRVVVPVVLAGNPRMKRQGLNWLVLRIREARKHFEDLILPEVDIHRK